MIIKTGIKGAVFSLLTYQKDLANAGGMFGAQVRSINKELILRHFAFINLPLNTGASSIAGFANHAGAYLEVRFKEANGIVR